MKISWLLRKSEFSRKISRFNASIVGKTKKLEDLKFLLLTWSLSFGLFVILKLSILYSPFTLCTQRAVRIEDGDTLMAGVGDIQQAVAAPRQPVRSAQSR